MTDREGHESIGSLKEAYKDKIIEARRKASVPTSTNTTGVPPERSTLQQPAPPPPQPQNQQTSQPLSTKPSSSAPGIKPLSSYLDLSKVSSLSNKEIEYLWRFRHASNPLSLCAVVPLTTYIRIYNTAKSHPQFILPLPRPASDDGSGDVATSESGFTGGERTAADVHFMQWNFHPAASPPTSSDIKTSNTHTSTVIFTHLAAFKVHGQFAQPHTTITHHLDLADSHGIVLLNGSVMDGKGVSVEEGRWLLMCLQKFYDFEGHGGGIGKENRQGLLQKFSNGDSDFSLEELLDEAERVS